jgi:hypothetical protein
VNSLYVDGDRHFWIFLTVQPLYSNR